VALAFAQLAVALALRPRHQAGERNPMLLVAVGLNVVLATLAASWNPLRELLRAERLALHDLIPCLVAACVAGAVAWWQAHPGSTRRRPSDLGPYPHPPNERPMTDVSTPAGLGRPRAKED
jgi:hypothetical protein